MSKNDIKAICSKYGTEANYDGNEGKMYLKNGDVFGAFSEITEKYDELPFDLIPMDEEYLLSELDELPY